MKTLKAEIYDVCNEIVSEFPGWSFSSGQFKNKSLKHSDLVVHLGFAFESSVTSLIPSLSVENKKVMKLMKSLVGYEQATSLVSFQAITKLLSNTPEQFRGITWITQNKSAFCAGASADSDHDNVLDISQARSVLREILKDGIEFFSKNYDLSDEESLLKSLPVSYPTQHPNSPYDQIDRQKGIALCVAHIVLGDFDFVELYKSDEYKTVFPKRTTDIEKILVALPDLKKRFEETGSVI